MGKQFHPVANVFPLMEGEAFHALVDDIRENGLLEDIYIDSDGLILDGRNRYRACLEAGVEPTFKNWNGRADALLFVVSKNLRRRHLTEGQRAMIAARIANLGQGNPKLNPPRGGIEHVTIPEAAKLLGISARTVERGRLIQRKGTTSLQRAVEEGKIPIAAAATLTKEREEFQARVVEHLETGEGRNVNTAKRKVRQALTRERAKSESREMSDPHLIRDLNSPNLQGKIRCIYADPPWPYRDQGTRGAAAHHYPDMSLDDICALPINKLAHSAESHLWLWTTFPMLRDGAPQAVLDAWGFVWSGEIVWDKEIIGTGHYIRGQTELLLLGVRGRMPLLENTQASIHREKRSTEHSRKPETFYQIIERLSPGPRIELFARGEREGMHGSSNAMDRDRT